MWLWRWRGSQQSCWWSSCLGLKTGKPRSCPWSASPWLGEDEMKCPCSVVRQKTRSNFSFLHLWFYSDPEGNLLYWIQKQTHTYAQKLYLISCLGTLRAVQLTYNNDHPRSPPHCLLLSSSLSFLPRTYSIQMNLVFMFVVWPHQLHECSSLRELHHHIPRARRGSSELPTWWLDGPRLFSWRDFAFILS